MLLAFLVSSVTVVLIGEREKEPGDKDKWAKGAKNKEGRGRIMVGRSHFRSCQWLVGIKSGSTFHCCHMVTGAFL